MVNRNSFTPHGLLSYLVLLSLLYIFFTNPLAVSLCFVRNTTFPEAMNQQET